MGVHCRRSGSKRKRPSISRDKRARTAALSNWRRAFFLLYKVVDSPAPDQDRKPVSVEEDNCGWDVTSLDDGQVARYIEVKGRAGRGWRGLDAQRMDQIAAVWQRLLALRSRELQIEPAASLDPRPGIEVESKGRS